MRELKRIRNERGWSQQRLADESSVNKATINQVEQGKRSPTIETLEKLANALSVEVADFFPKAQARLPLEERQQGSELELWTLYLNRLAEDFEDLAKGEVERCRQHGWGDVVSRVTGNVLWTVEALLDEVRHGTVPASRSEVRGVLLAGIRLSRAADRIDKLATPTGEEEIMEGVRRRQDQALTELRFRQIVEGMELSARDQEEIFT